MKKVWENPIIGELKIKETREDEQPITEQGYENSTYKLDFPSTDAKWRWRCPCCNAASKFEYDNVVTAVAAYFRDHAKNGRCPKRGEDGSCPIS